MKIEKVTFLDYSRDCDTLEEFIKNMLARIEVLEKEVDKLKRRL